MEKRQEIKYFISKINFEKLKTYFNLKKIYSKRQINSIYYDTDNYKFFIDSEEGTVSRKKLRFRWYGNKILDLNTIGNFEIKKTFDTYRTKNKSKMKYTDVKSFINKTINKKVSPKVIVTYHREYYAFKNFPARITFDENIKFMNFLSQSINRTNYLKVNTTLLEIKSKTQVDCSKIFNLSEDKKTRFSKYCDAIHKLSKY